MENYTINCIDGLIVPCWQPLNNVPTFDIICRGFVYFCSLAYLFIGVSIISDRFMAAVEVITSQEKEVSKRKPNGEKCIIVVRVWNETVANLTLLALGSSAPEILLSVIEICARNFEAGDLGPGTIVGSAAYNLFVIIAICVSVIPNGEVRKIKHLHVFFVTATWSVFAYIWLYLILAIISPGVVEIWESVLTFLFFPITVLTAYIADKKYYKVLKKGYRLNTRGVIVESMELGDSDLLPIEELDKSNRLKFIETLKELRAEHPNSTEENLERLAHELLLNQGPKSRAFYRIQATRTLRGSSDYYKRISKRAFNDISEVKAELRRESTTPLISQARVMFDPPSYTVLESCGSCTLHLIRSGEESTPISIEYKTVDGTASAGTDYHYKQGTVHFKPGETNKTITIDIIDDEIFESDEHFYVKLISAQPEYVLGEQTKATVFVLDDDLGGQFKFDQRNYELVESVGTFELVVKRCSGARGEVVVPFRTEDGTAKAGKEYEHVEGQLVFEDNEIE